MTTLTRIARELNQVRHSAQAVTAEMDAIAGQASADLESGQLHDRRDRYESARGEKASISPAYRQTRSKLDAIIGSVDEGVAHRLRILDGAAAAAVVDASNSYAAMCHALVNAYKAP